MSIACHVGTLLGIRKHDPYLGPTYTIKVRNTEMTFNIPSE
jgi:hypothetical protein